MAKNRVYESMTKVHTGNYTIRVWCIEKEFKPGPREDVHQAIAGHMRIAQIAFALELLPDISAYEILDNQGNGAIVYPDWK